MATRTIRQHIRRRATIGLGILFGAWLAMGALGIATRGAAPWFAAAMAAGALIFIGGIIYLTFFLRCPRCSGRVGQTIAWALLFQWGWQQRVNFCPYCGVKLDEPVSPSATIAT